jgi:hypothetical protein
MTSRCFTREAKRRDVSVSEVVRRFAQHLRLAGCASARVIAIGRSGKRHTARDAETILWREWGDARRR